MTARKVARLRDVRDCWGCTACVKACRRQAIAYYLAADLGGAGAKLFAVDEKQTLTWKLEFPDGSEQSTRASRHALVDRQRLDRADVDGLRQVVKQYGFDGLIVGVRRDEEGSRSKSRRIFRRGITSECIRSSHGASSTFGSTFDASRFRSSICILPRTDGATEVSDASAVPE